MTRSSCFLLLTLLLVGPVPAIAEGALAVGTAGPIAKDGIAVGGSINRVTKDSAIAKALAVCHAYQSALKAAANCKIVATFTRKCFATAFDPLPGTPGSGWAVGSDKDDANAQAMNRCKETAGKGRRQFCKIDQTYCDTEDTRDD